MAQITNEMIHCTYDIGKKVHAGQLSQQDGSVEISRQSGMKQSSAHYYIVALLAMLKGICYSRTINLYAAEYYLKNIGTDFGRNMQKRAAYAVLEHVKYYSEKHAHLVSTEKIAKRYSN